MAIITKSVNQTLVMWHTHLQDLIPKLDIYGSLIGADKYFSQHLRGIPWKRATVDNKKAALREATFLIDQLNYDGEADTDDHAFPRDGQAIPLAVEIASYEIALQLIQGVDLEIEIRSQNVTSRTYQSLKTTYNNKTSIPLYMRAGIPSSRAWDLLKPYLADNSGITLNRVS
jgi:hypothetical protein